MGQSACALPGRHEGQQWEGRQLGLRARQPEWIDAARVDQKLSEAWRCGDGYRLRREECSLCGKRFEHHDDRRTKDVRGFVVRGQPNEIGEWLVLTSNH